MEAQRNRPVYTLGVTSELAEIPAHSIRQYIDTGLIIPYKLESGRHLFSQGDVTRLKAIQLLIREHGLNFAGVRSLMAMLPCWAIRKCSENDQKSCGAYSDNFQPCWMASEKGSHCKNENCRECEVYGALNLDCDIKAVLKELL